MRLFSEAAAGRARPGLAGLWVMGVLVIGGCAPDEVNQPQIQPEVPISLTVAPTGGLVGEWKLDEMGGTTAADTKNGYNATVLGGAAFVPGKLGRALNLNNGTAGTGTKFAEMPSNVTLDDVQENNYTISAWFWAYTAPSGSSGSANQRWAVIVKAGFHMGLAYEPNRFTMRHYLDLAGPSLRAVTSSATYGLNAWHHVAGVVDRTAGTVTLYVNGASAGTTTFTPNTAALDYGATRFRIGKGSSNWAADGKVDQVRIYNRALSTAEISDLYNETTGGPTEVSNCIGAPTNGADKTTYSERRVFLESQGWWGERNPNGTVPKYGDAEHLHVGMCFPLRDTVSGFTTFRVRIMGHKLPVGSVIKSTGLHDPHLSPPHISLASIAWNDTITQADHDDPDGLIKWDSVTFNTTKMPNGLREFRILTTVVRPREAGQTKGAEIHASSGWCWTIANPGGSGPVASGTCIGTGANFTMARGWYDCFEYKLGEVRSWDPYATIPRGANYTLTISGRDGAGDNNDMTGWVVRLNPDFHRGFPGVFVDSGGGSAIARSVTIDGARMTAGLHKLVVIGFAKNNCTTPTGVGIKPQNGEVSAVLAIPLKVD